MRYRWMVCGGLMLLLATGCASFNRPRDLVQQTSILGALKEGAFQGQISVAELLRQGDFGLGTFEHLDGEMIVLNRRCYQARADGSVRRAPPDLLVPFACMTWFEADRVAWPPSSMDLDGLVEYLDQMLPTPNLIYAIKVEGTFPLVHVRACRPERPPYRRLSEAVAEQKEFLLRNVSGTLVGFRFPGFLGDLNEPGYHFHFLAADQTRGGHVLALRTGKVTIEVDLSHQFLVTLPQDDFFYKLVLPAQTPAAPEEAEENDPPAPQEP